MTKLPLVVLTMVALLVAPAAAEPNNVAAQPRPEGFSVTGDGATSDAAAYPGDDFLDAQRQVATEPRIETFSRERPVAPGVLLRSFDQYGPDGYTGAPTWLQGDSLSVDLTAGTTVDYLFPGQVASGEPLSAQASRVGAVAAVNGDFFDINNSSAPLGVGVRGGEVVQSPDTDPAWRRSAAIFTPDGLGSIGEVFFEGTITTPAGSINLSGINKPVLAVGGSRRSRRCGARTAAAARPRVRRTSPRWRSWATGSRRCATGPARAPSPRAGSC